MNAPHVSVLLKEVIEAIAPRDGSVIVDATFGAGGYSRAILNAAPCQLWAIDRDPRAIAIAQDLQGEEPERFRILEGRFSEMDNLLAHQGVQNVDAVVMDIGVSSMQLDEAERGFSFQKDGPLDMRMSPTGESAADVVNTYEQDALADLIYIYGEEKKSRRVAKAIVDARKDGPIERTLALADIVAKAIGGGYHAVHPATKTFQAIRIHVNQELQELEAGLVAAEHLLCAGGRLAVVTFHSLEDRIVKRFFDARTGRSSRQNPSRHLPKVQEAGPEPSFFQGIRKALKPSPSEINENPRARSAKLRWAVRTPSPAWVKEGEAVKCV